MDFGALLLWHPMTSHMLQDTNKTWLGDLNPVLEVLRVLVGLFFASTWMFLVSLFKGMISIPAYHLSWSHFFDGVGYRILCINFASSWQLAGFIRHGFVSSMILQWFLRICFPKHNPVSPSWMAACFHRFIIKILQYLRLFGPMKTPI